MKFKYKNHYTICNDKVTLYLYEDTYVENVHKIEAASEYLFKNCKQLQSLDFSDVSASSIQLGGEHNLNPGYFMMIRHIKLDFSDLDEVIKKFVKEWNQFMDEDVKAFKSFTEDGEKYGWD